MEQTATPLPPKRRIRGGRILTIVVLILLFAAALFVWWRYYFTYSSGYRYGLLQKFSKRGNLFKTYEGEMILSSVKGNNNVPLASEKFYFSVTDAGVAQQMDNLQGHGVTVHYKQKNSPAFWRGDSEYIVDSVRTEQ
ncbi:hypothetical protein [Flavisolibacter ginsenosidimutans]|uniref:6-phosphogluconate dehydrogenase n=1 Tax=Flavisolibacter ginsenosidimutans TaxID=661481 RepID=A0A5B8UL57_9BACT|nr:hypothetical protein [Flavisolibacter ginsenosidimutans]QEC56770.1 hypothetical protein FSB75_12970 [Flavisolibacter ginsenosidimutans]